MIQIMIMGLYLKIQLVHIITWDIRLGYFTIGQFHPDVTPVYNEFFEDKELIFFKFRQ